MRKKVVPMIAAMFLMTSLFGMTAYAKEGADLVNGQTVTASYMKTGEQIYHKVTLPADGTITISGKTVHSNLLVQNKVTSLDLDLCNAARVPTVSAVYLYESNNYCRTFVLKAGTYYLSTNDVHSTGLTYSYGYELGYTFQPVKEKAGAKKAKAVNLKKNKTISGFTAIGETTANADWYKFKLKKNQKIKLYFQAVGDAGVTYTLYGPSYKRGTIVTLKNETKKCYSLNVLTNQAVKIKKGTYYLKVTKSSYSRSTNSASYTIRWK